MSLQIAFRHSFPGLDFDVSIEAPSPGVTVLFGPSGAGKSTVAAVAAGLLRPLHGRVAVDGIVLADSSAGVFVSPERRRVGFVFQDARLFPHLTVSGNLRYGLRRVRDRSRDGSIGWDDVIDLLGIAGLLERLPSTLSGGERQRVAIGRALLSQPRLLIMDEPLAGLDAARRTEILPYLANLRDTLALPILYITHAVDEVARLADTLALIEHGRSLGVGPLAEMVARTDLPITARDDAGAVLSCTVHGHIIERSLTRLGLDGAPGLELLIPLQKLPPGRSLRVRVPATEVILATVAPSAISVQNILPARIVALASDSTTGSTLVELRLGTAPFLARVTPDAITRLRLAPGREVLALIKSVSVQILVCTAVTNQANGAAA